MLSLLLSILFSSLIFVIFTHWGQRKGHLYPVIWVNYGTCLLFGEGFGSLMGEGTWRSENVADPAFKLLFSMGLLFVGTFLLMGTATRRAGAASAATATKLSLVIPMGAAVLLYGEPLGWSLVLSVVLSIISIGLFSGSDGLKFDPILMAVFAGAGLVDAALNAIRQSFHSEMNDWQQSTVIFGSAFLFGSLGLLKSEWRKQFSGSAMVMGLLLGLVNFFSIVFLLRGLHSFQRATATFFALNNVGILLVTSLAAWLFFKQPMGFSRWMGLLVAVLAIASAFFNLLWTLA
jgi:drug/metabolite transporter (DMT)-like permease